MPEKARCSHIYMHICTYVVVSGRFPPAQRRVIARRQAGRLKRSRVFGRVASSFIFSVHVVGGCEAGSWRTCQTICDRLLTRFQASGSLREPACHDGHFKAYRGVFHVGNPLNLLLVIVLPLGLWSFISSSLSFPISDGCESF